MYVIRSIFEVALLLAWFPVGIFAQLQTPDLDFFLRKQVGVTPLELSNLEKGQTIVKLPKTSDTREVAVFAVVRLDVPPEFFVDSVRDIVTFKTGDNVMKTGKFSNPPRLEDLSGLTLEPADIEGLRRCRVNNCDMKLPARTIERFRKEVNWSAPNYRERASELFRLVLLENVQNYLKAGNAALGEYNDKAYVLRIADEFATLLQPAPYMYAYSAEFEKHLKGFPHANDVGAEDFIYWSKEKFGMKPVVSVTHVSIYKRNTPSGLHVLIASKGIYATHYFEVSLGMTGFVQCLSEPNRSYLIYINRSRADALRGLFAGLKRSLISGSVRDGTRKNMELIKERLERDYNSMSKGLEKSP